jgi:hypothetical protein
VENGRKAVVDFSLLGICLVLEQLRYRGFLYSGEAVS